MMRYDGCVVMPHSDDGREVLFVIELLTSIAATVMAGVLVDRICKWRREINIKSLFPVLSLRNKSKPLNRSLLRASPGRAGQKAQEMTTSPIKKTTSAPGGFLLLAIFANIIADSQCEYSSVLLLS